MAGGRGTAATPGLDQQGTGGAWAWGRGGTLSPFVGQIRQEASADPVMGTHPWRWAAGRFGLQRRAGWLGRAGVAPHSAAQPSGTRR